MAVKLAKNFNGEIISADSRQVFRGMDIGTGKDLAEYEDVPHHLIDIVNAGSEFSVSDFQKRTIEALKIIEKNGAVPVICGGTGHYIKALIEDYQFDHQPSNLELTNELEKLDRNELNKKLQVLGLWNNRSWESDSKRRIARAIEKAMTNSSKSNLGIKFSVQFSYRLYYLKTDRSLIKQKIRIRLIQRIEEGMIEEVEQLLKDGISHERLRRYGLEYKRVSQYLQGEFKKTDLIEKLQVDISRFAKRQMTFLRYLQKCGHTLTGVSDYGDLAIDVSQWLDNG